MVWQPSQPHQKTAFISQSCPPTLSILFQCLLVWSLTESLPSELPNKIQGESSEKLYKISFQKWSTEWKPWASFWRINTLCIRNKENGLCLSRWSTDRTADHGAVLLFTPSCLIPQMTLCTFSRSLHKLQESLCNFLKFLLFSLSHSGILTEHGYGC